LVVLDVDNGPGYLVHTDNADLYRTPFLGELRRIIRPAGVVAVWSGNRAPELVEAMEVAFGQVSETSYSAQLPGRDEDYWLYLAQC
ncbi:MAG: hypothetical protein M3130_09170, partial [Actinomycetota bacterium]|nr:hypothetical protein [Actinomycetota bacterium]